MTTLGDLTKTMGRASGRRLIQLKQVSCAGIDSVKQAAANAGDRLSLSGLQPEFTGASGVGSAGGGESLIQNVKSTFRQMVPKESVTQEVSYSKIEDVQGAQGINEVNFNNINDFISGSKQFDDVLNDYAILYAEKIKTNEPWSWGEDILGAENLTLKHKHLIKEQAISKGYISQITVNKVDGMRYGFADFAGAHVVKETVYLPEDFWKLSDRDQFKWLDEKIGGHQEGMTWHHTETPGKMELLPYGIHNITPHNGGRTVGMWADAPR